MTLKKDNKVIRLENFRAKKEIAGYLKTHVEMERAWQFACELVNNMNTQGLDAINVKLSLYKLMVLKLQNDGYDYHSLRRILQKAFDEDR